MGKRQRKRPRQDPEARAAARDARRVEKHRAVRRIRRARRLRRTAIWGGLAIVVGVGGFLLFRPGPELEGVIREPQRGRDHVSTPVSYGTPTPTSGPHSPNPADCGWHESQVSLEQAVHALEHGAVVVWYRPDEDDRLANALRPLIERFDHHLIISPNGELDSPIVATAWTRHKAYQDPEEVAEFVETYRERGPEKVPCDA